MRKIVKAMTAALLIGVGCLLLPGCGSTPSASGTTATQQVPKGEKEQATYYMNQMDQCIEKAKTIRKQFEEDNKAKAENNPVIKDMVEGSPLKVASDVQKISLDQAFEAWAVLDTYYSNKEIKENDDKFNEANQKLGDLVNHGKNGPAIDKMTRDWRHKKYNDDIISKYQAIVHPTKMAYITQKIVSYAELKDYEIEMGTTSRTKEQRAQAQAFAKEHKIKYTEPT